MHVSVLPQGVVMLQKNPVGFRAWVPQWPEAFAARLIIVTMKGLAHATVPACFKNLRRAWPSSLSSTSRPSLPNTWKERA